MAHMPVPLPLSDAWLASVEFNTQEVINGEIYENVIVQAANVALENTGKTLTWMLTPRLLKPLVWSLVAKFPPPQIRALNVARMQLYTAALTLARNAMGRLGMAWTDELNMAAAFGKLKGDTMLSAACRVRRLST